MPFRGRGYRLGPPGRVRRRIWPRGYKRAIMRARASRAFKLGRLAGRMTYAGIAGYAAYRVGKSIINRRKRIAGTAFKSPRLQQFYQLGGTTGPEDIVNDLPRKTLWSARIRFNRMEDQTVKRLGEITGFRVHVKGMKVCLTVDTQGTAPTPEDDITFHFAILQRKQDDEGIAITGSNFFSNPGGGTTGNEQDFDFVPASTDPIWDARYNCNGINPTRFNVVTHKRLNVLHRNNDSTTNKKHLNQYIKINKTFQYENKDDQYVRRPLYAVCWYERQMPSAGGADGNIVLARFSLNTTTYFRSIS